MTFDETFDEWTKQIIEDFRGAGFTVGSYLGFPLVEMPSVLAESVRLIKFHGSVSADKRIYAEGMLLVPAGSPVEERFDVRHVG